MKILIIVLLSVFTVTSCVTIPAKKPHETKIKGDK